MRHDILRLGTTLCLAVVGITALVVACGDDRPTNNAVAPSSTATPTSTTCATPQEGCPCPVEAAVTACGNKVVGPSPNFIYCYEGLRTCTNGRWGACGNGTVQTKSIATPLYTDSLSAGGTACSGGIGTNVTLCNTGKFQNQTCTSNADCVPGESFCTGATELTKHCHDDGDCVGDCQRWLGHCNGGTNANEGCNADTDCPGSTCNIQANGHDCIGATGLCEGGSNDSNPCTGDPQCPGGHCDITNKFGVCLGGKHNGKKCKNDQHCLDGNSQGSCSNDIGVDGGTALDPCDPYCNVYTDTQDNFDAGAGFIVGDGGITLGAKCGDGLLAPPEQCDDGNTTSGDGCSSTCTIETGYFCPTPGSPCAHTVCGNGVKEGAEACDDGNTTSGDGCSSTCTLEAGYYCPTPGSPCLHQTCGNGTVEGTEQCDDGNLRPYDGCFNCQNEVKCTPASGGAATPCTATCGDGVKFATEACDDGNLTDGDGCDHLCNVEPGSVCTVQLSALPASIDVPAIYRDFWPYLGTTPPAYGHPDFEHDSSGNMPHAGSSDGACVHTPTSPNQHAGIMLTQLDTTDKEPDANPSGPFKSECNVTSVNQWYRDDAAHNKVILGRYIRLFKTSGSQYVFNSSSDSVTTSGINCGDGTNSCATTLTSGISPGFFPLQNQGWGNFYPTSYSTTPPWSGAKVNFGFTSEVRFPFTYKGDGTEVFNFTGDDDVFVYIGGREIVDLGGVHGPVSSPSYTLSATSKDLANNPLGLVVGNTYELDVFQAERNTVGSNYKLTLAGFQRQVSVCVPPPPPQTLVRDYVAQCPPGSKATWSLFRWEAACPAGPTSTIDFRAATADTQTALPASKTDPSTVSIGQANATNSPAGGSVNWASLTQSTSPFDPIPVEAQLEAATPNQTSKQWLRVYMTFTGAPVLYQWQMLYDCVPNE